MEPSRFLLQNPFYLPILAFQMKLFNISFLAKLFTAAWVQFERPLASRNTAHCTLHSLRLLNSCASTLLQLLSSDTSLHHCFQATCDTFIATPACSGSTLINIYRRNCDILSFLYLIPKFLLCWLIQKLLFCVQISYFILQSVQLLQYSSVRKVHFL